MDDNNLDNQKKQQEQQEAGQKTAHVAGKAAATYFGGPAGGALYNAASNTAVGKKIEQVAGNALQQIPIVNKASQNLNKSGALDVADKALDVASVSKGSGLNNQSQSSLTNQVNNLSNISGNNNDKKDNSSTDSDNSESNENDSNDLFSLFGSSNNTKKIKFAIAGGLISTGLVLCMLIFAAASLLAPLHAIKEFVENVWNGIVDFFTKDQQELEEEFYQELYEVQQDFKKDYKVCIDINLITASLTVNRTYDKVIEGSGEIDENGEDVVDSEGNKETLPYTKMKKQVRLLAKMQMINAHYELDGNSDSYCANSSQTKPVTEGDKNSSSFELIASHDKDGILALFTSKVNEEQNNAYYYYYPPFDSEGNCSHRYAKEKLPEDKYVLSIDNVDNPTETVFYWNLVNSFIPTYYKDEISDVEPQKTDDIKRIADEIYLLYKQLGPSQTCATTAAYNGPGSICPNGITIENVGTYDLEEYIAGVVSNEAYASEGMEALKAQAVAARTYALNYTNNCTRFIPNSTSAQTFTQNIKERAKEAVDATKGEILLNLDGKFFSSMYDSFCYDDVDCPDSKKNSDGTYTVTYTKMPYREKHTITLSDPSQFGRITHGKGHAYGMSQLLSYQMAKEGKNYKEILAYFYSDGVSINSVSQQTTEGAEIIKGPVTNYIASVDDFNQTIYDQVTKSGVGTREGVVAAATTLVSKFYNQTGYKLPYELYPSGKYNGYGIDSNWGTNTGNASYPLNGLDCSGFVSWAIHNGGFAYELKSAKDWGNSGTQRSWSYGTKDDKAQPGDLIFNKPKNDNGTTGHIRMIIGVNSDGYVVAEASSGSNGVRITNISFTSVGSYYLVDMSNYYEKATKVTDYPS